MTSKYNNIKSISIGILILITLIILKFIFCWTDEFLTAIISGVAFIGFIISLQLQRNSIDIQHQELKNSIEEIRNQTEEFKKQNQEHEYKRMLDLTYKQIELTNNEIVRIIDISNGKRVIDEILYINSWLHSYRPDYVSDTTKFHIEFYETKNIRHQEHLNEIIKKIKSIFKYVDTCLEQLNTDKINSDVLKKYDFQKMYLSFVNYDFLVCVLKIVRCYHNKDENYIAINKLHDLRDVYLSCISILPIITKNENILSFYKQVFEENQGSQ